ncbi:hypothetical protein ACI65C_009222 [Semiaphis heraclei]
MAYCNIVNKTKHNFKTKIGNEYTTKDVLKVWNCISEWIENNISQDKGVLIKGIGYFTVAQWELNGSKVNPYTIRKPVFLIDEKLANDFNLKRRRAYNSGTIPERYFNVLTIAQNFKLNIDMVNHCFKEVVAAFRKLLFENKNCELPFPKIGKLRIKNKIVTMKYYEEFIERQNKHFKNRMVKDKKKNQAVNYNPDWDADQYESRKRPCSAMSTISRPASSLSQYRPGTGYEGVLPNADGTTDRPNSRQSVDYNCNGDDDDSMVCRPGSRLSVRSNTSHHEQTTRPHSSRPASSLSQHCRPGTGDARVLPNTDSTTDRLNSRLSAHPGNGDENEDITCRPDSRLSVRPKSSQAPTRPQSRSPLQPACRPLSSVQSARFDRPVSRSRTVSCDEIYHTRPRPRTSKHNRPSTGTSVRSAKSNCSLLSKNETSSSHACPATKLVATPEPLTTSCVVDPTVRPCSNLSKSKLKEDNNHGGDGKNTLIFGPDRDETLCHLCNIREYRLRQIDNMYKPDLFTEDNRANFIMKGDNPINGLISTEVLNKRKDNLIQISNYNYNTAKKLLNANESEKNKNRKEKNNESFILKQRPASVANFDQRVKFKRSLLDQIESNKIKKEIDKIASLNFEKLEQKELIKSLYDERIKNIEAKNRAKQNYLMILKEHQKNKSKITQEEKKNDITIPLAENFINFQKLNNNKCRQIANYQLKQKDERNRELREEKEKKIDFERSILNRLKEKDEILQRNFVQKKLDRTKLLSEDMNKLFGMSKSERHKNDIPGSYVSLVLR